MPTIIKLSPELINQIAAGEIVERPASVVKELVENSLDSKSTSIKIIIEEAGLKKITVIDDGHGMTADELKIAVKSHTTSKITSADNLTNIKTMGFRGEALASIGQVSHLSLNSKTPKDRIGNSLQIAGGKLQGMTEIGMPTGTRVTVENLFYNTPARKKFLKSDKTEFNRILEVVTSLALANSEIKFKLSHNGKIIFDLPSQNNTQRIQTILGKNLWKNFLPVESDDPYFSIKGGIAKPQLAKNSANKQYIYVNKRQVNNRFLKKTIKEAFGSLLAKNTYPPFVLFLEIPFTAVDVNIHPRKEEVAFSDQKTILKLIRETIQESLAKHDLIFYSSQDTLSETPTKKFIYPTDIPKSPTYQLEDSANISQTNLQLKKKVKPWITKLRETSSDNILQINNLYLVVELDDGIMLIDQHAAHERILYEQYLEAFKKERVARDKEKMFVLKRPLVFELPVVDREFLKENLKSLKKLGFEVKTARNKKTFQLISIPKLLKNRTDLVDLITQIIADLREEKNPNLVDNISLKLVQYMACRTAIKAGDYLEPKERKRLLERLEKCDKPYTCPHGRPTKVVVNIKEIEKMFGR